MKCPNCNETLLMTHRNNIEIDYCPSCRGVWLDRGELDKMLELVSQNPGKNLSAHRTRQEDPGNHYSYRDGYKKPYRKKSFLGDLFDFD